ncbi:ergosterol biosynthesis ERG4/ERG24 family-domain-containing protein [Lasiosphaeria ovina]|uniref:7-dehydrocholesterol reductase n=1 Tax=Lasiosphaeria ovina TaxID=92902 RepID=A0AAE0K5K9_9PEZI|nr:ergosterol biosynthesis ERG4/ERG24 family-domain-containing protein [Lasiosphaeria ovina]
MIAIKTTEIEKTAAASVSLPLTDVKIWGRTGAGRSWLGSLVASLPLVLAPLTCASVFITLRAYSGSFSLFAAAVAEEGFWPVYQQHGPQLTAKGAVAVVCYVGLQALLFRFLPGELRTGQYTPAGHLLTYRMNGLSAWTITHLLYFALSWAGVLDPAFIARNWSGLIAAMNIAGLAVSVFAFVKAYVSPTHPDDRKFSGSSVYDFFMGIELNPRLGEMFDLKLFSNGRPGMILWTLINFSNLAYQHQTLGHVEPSLALVTVLQVMYVVDFFVNESWYLGTIDIAHDHYGFYLGWGCFCFLPIMYTVQAQYLGMHPPAAPASYTYLAVVFAAGLVGYAMFRSVNDQKSKARLLGHGCCIWGKPAQYIVAPYRTTDGRAHKSLLLCSGWWGWSRHANYVGDLLLSYSFCALVRSTNAVVWTYAVWMTLCLVHRCMRDEKRLSVKYGAAWTEYCQRVPWRFVPGVW